MFEKMNARLKKLTVVDIGLVKWSALFTGIVVSKLFPQLLEINYGTLIFLALACGARPLYKFWLKK